MRDFFGLLGCMLSEVGPKKQILVHQDLFFISTFNAGV